MSDWYVSSAAYTAIPQFAASTAYTVGQFVRPLTAPTFNAQYAFRCTTAGTSSTEPAWPPNNNQTVTTGGATFTNVTASSTYGWAAAAGNTVCIGPSGSGAQRVAVGDRIFLSSDHAEASSNIIYIGPQSGAYAAIGVISVNRAGSVPPAAADALSGASITYNGASAFILEPYCNVYWQGITFTLGNTGSAFYFSVNGIKSHYFKNCAFVFTTSTTTAYLSGGQSACQVTFDNTTVTFNNAGQRFQTTGNNYPCEFKWLNTPAAVPGTVPTNLFLGSGLSMPATLVTCRGVDLSAVTTTLYYGNGQINFGKVLFDSCRIAPAVVRLGVTGLQATGDEVELVNCYDGTGFLAERHTPAGDLTTELSITLSGGAQDNVGLYSHKLVSSTRSDKYAMTLDSFWMDTNYATTGSAKTATIELLATPLNTDDISLVLEYQGTSGSSLASFVTSFPAVAPATPVALTSSSATWNNTPAAAANTFNPTFNPSGITLSGGNLTATGIPTGTHQSIRTTYSFTSGKIYFEGTMLVLGSAGCGLGIGNTNAGTAFLGGSVNGFQYISTGAVYTNNAVFTTYATFVVNDVICVAVDIANKKLWYRKNNGNWNNTAGNDPATNVGGLDLTALLASNGTIYPSFDSWQAGDRVTINLGSTAFAQTVPSGYAGPASGPAWTQQRLQVAFTPRTAGRVRGQVRLGKASTTVYVNPQVTIT